MNRIIPSATAIVILALLSGCESQAAPSKAGGLASPITLTLATADREGTPAAAQIERYVDEVAQLSDDRIIVEPLWQAARELKDDWDQAIAGMVVVGEADLALVPARAWEALGVDTLRPLQAPLLVASEDVLAEVVRDDVATEMLAGVADAGVEGLAMWPESLRYLFVFGAPPERLADFTGKAVRSAESDSVHALLEALGMRPGDTLSESAHREGAVAAAESSFQWTASLPAETTALGDLPLFPKVNTLVADPDAFAELSSDDQAVLREAAIGVRDWAAEHLDEEEAAAIFCRNGGTVAHLGQPLITEVRAALRPLYEHQKEGQNADVMSRIEAIETSVSGQPVAIPPCNGPSTAPEQPTSSADDFPEGVYRAEFTRSDLVEAGVDPLTAANHAGVWTLTFRSGELVVDDVNTTTGEQSTEPGVYCVEEGRVQLGISSVADGSCGSFWSSTWDLRGDELVFQDVLGSEDSALLLAAMFGDRAFAKIG